MSPTIRIDDETKAAIDQLGGTFDSADDVLRRLIDESGNGELLAGGDGNGDHPHGGPPGQQ
ncbi:hypothetical protein [Natranaeroarchaeum aerophilus]|uniref:Uncharacterized protein n=1 Tax=Natranaeroarchaeum aerophilus TaxID=2917711 RepID=A0AAE3FR17_9EURY|nr:hypothetical protein [Natranaeroarchaeum aerophilus]MCL9813729.1 hypothetical protein [Natranaeroarchaeum aerophilus]